MSRFSRFGLQFERTLNGGEFIQLADEWTEIKVQRMRDANKMWGAFVFYMYAATFSQCCSVDTGRHNSYKRHRSYNYVYIETRESNVLEYCCGYAKCRNYVHVATPSVHVDQHILLEYLRKVPSGYVKCTLSRCIQCIFDFNLPENEVNFLISFFVPFRFTFISFTNACIYAFVICSHVFRWFVALNYVFLCT